MIAATLLSPEWQLVGQFLLATILITLAARLSAF